ncbi:MAG: threonine synthase [Candidatus Micrarchaeia archaeon]
MDYWLSCAKCGKSYPSSYRGQTCAVCGGILEVEYKGTVRKSIAGARSFWDLEPLLPKGEYKHFEVGMTKLMASHESSKLFFKLEFENPTRSFKDRGSVVEVAKAKEYGYNKIVCASTGNMAYSIAYYAKLYGIEASVFISRSANKDKLVDIKSTHDAELHMINGDFTRAQGDAEVYAKKSKAFLAGDYCYRKEGQATIAYELLVQRPSLKNIIVPVGNATLFSALFKAYALLQKARMVKELPKLIGVEAAGCPPIYNAMKHGSEIKYIRPHTYADAIAVGFPTYGSEAVYAVNQTGGMFMVVSDAQMKAQQEWFYNEYGIKIELASAAGIAAYRKLGKAIRNEETAIILTGANV